MGLLDRLFARHPTDPAEAMIGWLKDKSLDDRRIVAGLLYGGPYSRRVTEWIVAQPDCDEGTASMVLWHMCGPHGCMREEAAGDVSGSENRALAQFIAAKWRDEGFAAPVFSWDPRDSVRRYRTLLTKKFGRQDPLGLPDAAWRPVAGRPPNGSPALDIYKGTSLNPLLGHLRLADLAKCKPEFWEADYRKVYG
jgi:hypothetical protein